jgi:hypothetical protein
MNLKVSSDEGVGNSKIYVKLVKNSLKITLWTRGTHEFVIKHVYNAYILVAKDSL